jgi:PPK2 family polyphosphate:nucleotide phosphotransferase
MLLEPIDPEAPLDLSDETASVTDAPSAEKLAKKRAKYEAALGRLQNKLYADGRYGLLVVLQGRDASGKDGTIKHVFSAVNPQGCEVSSFKEPTPLERKHDFLWRVHARVPARGMLGIFNRSHYEDVLAPRVNGTVARPIWMSRYEQINDFERMLVQNNVVILKFFLHVSRAVQRRRVLDRLETPKKNWKFRSGDLDDRRLWDEYTEAYTDMLRRCSTKFAPWYVVPSDDEDIRNYLVLKTVVRTLKKLKLHYPEVDPDTLLRAEQSLFPQ